MAYSNKREPWALRSMPIDAATEQFWVKPCRKVYDFSMSQVDVKAQRPPLKSLPVRYKARSRHHKFRKRFSKRRMPYAPRNTTSFIMRANKMGIKAPFFTPLCPTMGGTPLISPAPWPIESLGDGQVASDLGVNAYGSMNGCIRLRADAEDFDVEGDKDPCSSSCNESEMDHGVFQPASSVQQVEERIDHCLQRFELLRNDNCTSTNLSTEGLYAKMEDQENHINHLEEVNLSLHQKLWAAQQELSELRRRLGNEQSGPEICSDESLGDGSCAA